MSMPLPQPASAVLDREFLEIRAKILELAASFDRLERGGAMPDDRRIELIQQGLRVLLDETGDRAEQVQLLFSRPYHNDWRKQFGLVADAADNGDDAPQAKG